MKTTPAKSARDAVRKTLNLLNLKQKNAAELLYSIAPDSPQATDILFGTIRHLNTLDTIITKCSARKKPQIKKNILNILRIATYELIYAPKTAQYAIVNEAVNIAAASDSKRAAPFVNAVLRNTCRHITDRSASIQNTPPTCALPTSQTTACIFDIPMLDDPQKNPAAYLANAFSLPAWLTKDWINNLTYQTAYDVCLASNTPPKIYIRPNTLISNTQKISDILTKNDILHEITPDNSAIMLNAPAAINSLPGLAEGLFTIQDITASLPVKALNPKPGENILDLCAAPGTKTTQLAELMNNTGSITATDINKKRLPKLHQNIKRLKIDIIKVVDYETLINSKQKFDVILIDAPCSNTGVLAKRTEARHNISQKFIRQLTQTQQNLLDIAAKMTKPNAKICYSTCSIQKNENQDIINAFLKNNPAFKLEEQKLSLPNAKNINSDGGFYAILTEQN